MRSDISITFNSYQCVFLPAWVWTIMFGTRM